MSNITIELEMDTSDSASYDASRALKIEAEHLENMAEKMSRDGRWKDEAPIHRRRAQQLRKWARSIDNQLYIAKGD